MKPLILALFAGLFGGLLGIYLFVPHQNQPTDDDPAYQHILRTKTLRCGYALYGKWTIRDPNTGQMSGISYDLAEQVGHDLGLKVEWTQEVGYGEIEQALRDHKFDVFCSDAIIMPKRATYALQTTPIAYDGLVTWVRADDHRFDTDLGKLNDPSIRLSTRDGDLADTVADDLFPKARKVPSPQLADFSQMLVDVQTGKADATFFDLEFGDEFLKHNPGSIRPIFTDQPVLMGQIAFMLPMHEPQLQNMLNVTLENLRLRGETRRILKKYLGDTPYYWQTALPQRQ